MKKINILWLVVLLIFPLLTKAQSAKRFWSDGPLTVADFLQTDTASHLAWYMGYTKVTEKCDGIYYTYYKALTYMLPYSSALASEADLPRMQMLFDRLELHRRELQQQLNEAESDEEFDDILTAARSRMTYDENRTHTTDIGQAPTASPIPIFNDRTFRFGVAIGTPLTVPTGDLAKMTGAAIGLMPAIEIGWNHSHVMTDLSLMKGTLAGTAGTAPHRFIQDNKYIVINAAFYYGHALYESRHLRLMPYAGAGLGILSSNTATDSASCIGINPQVGLTVDIPFYTHVITQSGNSGLFSFITSNHSIYNIRAQVFVRRDTWLGVSDGVTVGFNLGVSFLGRNTRPARNQ